MRICFFDYASLDNEPESMPCFDVASALASMGHDVHILTRNHRKLTHCGVHIYGIDPPSSLSFHPNTAINSLIDVSTRLCEKLMELSIDGPFDLIEAPLCDLQGFVTMHRFDTPIVLRYTGAQNPILKSETYEFIKLSLQIARGAVYDDERSFFDLVKSFDIDLSSLLLFDVFSGAIDQRIAFYERIVSLYSRRCLVSHVMEALDVGDAVSMIARRVADILADLGHPKEVLSCFWNKSLSKEALPLHYIFQRSGGVIFHYWNYSISYRIIKAARGRKAIYYHNVTPPDFFSHDPKLYSLMTQSYNQLKFIIDSFDLIIGDSWYNIDSLLNYTNKSVPNLVIYPIIEPDEVQHRKYNHDILESLRKSGSKNIVFIGRIARNKRQDRLIELFDYYWREINPSSFLWLVGSDQGDPKYRAMLEEMRKALPSGDHIHFTGKVTDEDLNAYYRAADLFVCASEHEGFCLPLAEAMAFDIPVIAYAAAAVPETMGGAGVLVHEWDIPRIAELMHLLVTNVELRQRMIDGQRRVLMRFSEAEARVRIKAVVDYLLEGTISPMFKFPKEQQAIHNRAH